MDCCNGRVIFPGIHDQNVPSNDVNSVHSGEI